MKSVKPGRGPSFMGGIGSVAVGIFGVIWTVGASAMGAPDVFVLFGLVFVALAAVQAIYQFRNAVGKRRFSSFDITGDGEEEDPLNERFGERQPAREPDEARDADGAGGFCPYCGAQAGPGFRYCEKCGRELPKAGEGE